MPASGCSSLTLSKLARNVLLSGVQRSATASVVQWSGFLATDPEVRVRFPALPDLLRSSGFGTGSTQPREYNFWSYVEEIVAAPV
jgi:hypothetical protein